MKYNKEQLEQIIIEETEKLLEELVDTSSKEIGEKISEVELRPWKWVHHPGPNPDYSGVTKGKMVAHPGRNPVKQGDPKWARTLPGARDLKPERGQLRTGSPPAAAAVDGGPSKKPPKIKWQTMAPPSVYMDQGDIDRHDQARSAENRADALAAWENRPLEWDEKLQLGLKRGLGLDTSHIDPSMAMGTAPMWGPGGAGAARGWLAKLLGRGKVARPPGVGQVGAPTGWKPPTGGGGSGFRIPKLDPTKTQPLIRPTGPRVRPNLLRPPLGGTGPGRGGRFASWLKNVATKPMKPPSLSRLGASSAVGTGAGLAAGTAAVPIAARIGSALDPELPESHWASRLATLRPKSAAQWPGSWQKLPSEREGGGHGTIPGGYSAADFGLGRPAIIGQYEDEETGEMIPIRDPQDAPYGWGQIEMPQGTPGWLFGGPGEELDIGGKRSGTGERRPWDPSIFGYDPELGAQEWEEELYAEGGTLEAELAAEEAVGRSELAQEDPAHAEWLFDRVSRRGGYYTVEREGDSVNPDLLWNDQISTMRNIMYGRNPADLVDAGIKSYEWYDDNITNSPMKTCADAEPGDRPGCNLADAVAARFGERAGGTPGGLPRRSRLDVSTRKNIYDTNWRGFKTRHTRQDNPVWDPNDLGRMKDQGIPEYITKLYRTDEPGGNTMIDLLRRRERGLTGSGELPATGRGPRAPGEARPGQVLPSDVLDALEDPSLRGGTTGRKRTMPPNLCPPDDPLCDPEDPYGLKESLELEELSHWTLLAGLKK